MSIQTEITRIQSARNTLRTKAVELKISAGTERLDELAADFDGILNQGSVSAQVKEGETYTIPKGYHDGTGTVSGVAGGGSYSLQSKTVTPTKSRQTVQPASGKVLSAVTVEPIPENYITTADATATAAHLLSGKTAYAGGSKITGTMADNGSMTATLDGLTVTSKVIPAGYTSGGTVALDGTIEEALAAI